VLNLQLLSSISFRGSIIGTSSIPMETQYHGDFMDPDFWLHNSSLDNDDARRVHLSETNFVDEKGKKPISLEDDVEANILDDFMDPCLCIDFSNLEDGSFI